MRHELDFPGSQAALWNGEIVEVCGTRGREILRVLTRHGEEFRVWRRGLDPVGPVARALVRLARRRGGA
jgi:hypothetical protein